MKKHMVVLPTYNEAENVRDMVTYLMGLPIDGLEVLVVDDNSPDGTGQIADQLAEEFAPRVHVLHRPGKQGLGVAYKAGFTHAMDTLGAEMIIQMDCDFSHSPDYLPEMVEKAQAYDVVIGSRYAPGGSLDDDWSIWRKLLSWWANGIYIRVILRSGVKDATGGFRVWNRRVLKSMDFNWIKSNGYVFQAEMAYVTERLGFSTYEVPIHFKDRKAGTSKMSLRIQLEAALRVWQVLFRHRKMRPADRLPGAVEAGDPA